MEEGGGLWWLFIAASLGISIWAIIDLGFLKGTDGDNEYGPDPFAKNPKQLSDVFE